jgi:hypothetical protein
VELVTDEIGNFIQKFKGVKRRNKSLRQEVMVLEGRYEEIP